MKRILLFLILISSAFAQAPRPPVSFLSQLGDVNITSPTDDQPLVWDAASSKWTNTNTLDDITLQSTASSPVGLAGTVANFNLAKLTNTGSGDVIDWSLGTLKILRPIADSSNVNAELINNRQLISSDGTTVKIDWSGAGIKLPTLTNLDTTAFLQTDGLGNINVVSIPSAGAVATTTNILMGDGGGNAVSTTPALSIGTSGINLQSSTNSDVFVDWWNVNTGASATAGLQLKNASGIAQVKLLGSSFSSLGIASADDLWIRNDIGTTGNVVITTNSGVTTFSNNGGTNERARIGNGVSVGTATDSGIGIVNASVGYRINNVDLADVYMNGSAAGATGFASNQAIPGSAITIPAGAWKAGGSYHCVFDMTKTAAGTAALAVSVHMGTLGTTSDAIVDTITAAGAGTAAADSGVFDVYVTFKSVGSGTTATVNSYFRLLKILTSTGLINTGSVAAFLNGGTSTGFNSTTQTKISLGFNGGASFVGTNVFSQTEYKQ